ncbi:MAG: hypothetical protein R3F11_23715 [Verrucomicrobiales bacterium]
MRDQGASRAARRRGVWRRAAARRGQARYGPGVSAALKALWLWGEQPCGRRLKAALPLWVPAWEPPQAGAE